MDYTPPLPVHVDQVTMPDIHENFVNYLKNDMLGQIANAHLAWTDLEHPSSPECVELATLHSVAVDFAKTGVPAELPNYLRPKEWPDFMGKPDHSYVSNKILGTLFRIVDPEPAYKELRQDEIERALDLKLGQVQVPSEILKLVAHAKATHYDMEIWALLLRYRPAEAEAFSGVVLRNASRYKEKDYDLKDPVTDAFRAIVEDTKAEILGRHDGMTQSDPIEQDETVECPTLGCTLSTRNLIAIACYQVAYLNEYQPLVQEMLEDPDDVTDVLSNVDFIPNSRR
jgi:RNA-dependent RNA polymerase